MSYKKTHSRLSTFAATVGGAAFLASTAASGAAMFQSAELESGYQNGSTPIQLADAHGSPVRASAVKASVASPRAP